MPQNGLTLLALCRDFFLRCRPGGSNPPPPCGHTPAGRAHQLKTAIFLRRELQADLLQGYRNSSSRYML